MTVIEMSLVHAEFCGVSTYLVGYLAACTALVFLCGGQKFPELGELDLILDVAVKQLTYFSVRGVYLVLVLVISSLH